MTPRISWIVEIDVGEVDSPTGTKVIDRRHFQSEQEARVWAMSQRREGVGITIHKKYHETPTRVEDVSGIIDGLTTEEQGTADMPGEPPCV